MENARGEKDMTSLRKRGVDRLRVMLVRTRNEEVLHEIERHAPAHVPFAPADALRIPTQRRHEDLERLALEVEERLFTDDLRLPI